MLSYCLNTTNMEWREVVVDHHVMIIITFVLWGDETYNNQPQKLQHTNKQYWYITWGVEQLYHAASMSRVGIYRKNIYESTMYNEEGATISNEKRSDHYIWLCILCIYNVSCLLLKWKLLGRGHHN